MITNRTSQRGLSLVELMISITIGLLILSALATLFVNQSRTRTELDKSNRLIDNGRYAMEVLSENLQLAGFYGEGELTVAPAISDPCTSNPNAPNLGELRSAVGLHVLGYDAANVSATLSSPPCGLITTNLKVGSDILVLRRADTTAVEATAAFNGRHYIQLSSCDSAVEPASFVIDTTPANYNLHQKNCDSMTKVRRFIVQTYFISPDNSAGDGIPTLKVKELDPAETAGTGKFITTPLVEGIEYLQVEYGIDTDNDGVANSYETTCADATCWSNVVSVKLYVIARNIEPTAGYNNTNKYELGKAGTFGPFNDLYKRRVYTQIVRLVNPSSRRETP